MKISIQELRERASQVLKEADISGVRLVRMDCRGSHPKGGGTLVVSAQVDVSGSSPSSTQVEAGVRYAVRAALGEDDNAEEAWTVKVELAATWDHPHPEKFEELDFQCFAMAMGLPTIHPYARELLQSTVTRMGFPPYVIEMIEPVTARPDSEELDIEVTAKENA